MRLLIFIVAFLLSAIGYSQSNAWAIDATSNDSKRDRLHLRSLEADSEFEKKATKVSPGNYWLGASTQINFSESTAFDGQLEVGGSAVTSWIPTIPLGKNTLNIYTRGNVFGLINDTTNVRVAAGLYPTLEFADTKANSKFLIHGGFEGIYSPTDQGDFDTRDKFYRGFLGPELTIYSKETPTVISPVFSYQNIIGVNNPSYGVELSVIIGLSKTMGLTFGGYYGMNGDPQGINGHRPTGFRIGFVTTSKAKA